MKRREVNDFEVREVDAGYATPCHIPLGFRDRPLLVGADGYSIVTRTVDGRKLYLRAHRVRYEAVRGALPDGMVPDHLCRHRPCCNPAHMEAVTIAENNRRGVHTKLTSDIVLRMRAMRADGVRNKEVAELFGVSEGHCSHVTRGEYWAEGLSPAWDRVKGRRLKAK